MFTSVKTEKKQMCEFKQCFYEDFCLGIENTTMGCPGSKKE